MTKSENDQKLDDQKLEDQTKSELAQLRIEIDQLDSQIALLLASRYELVQEIGKRKSVHQIPVLDPQRELNIIAKVRSKAKDNDCADFIQKIFEQIFKASRDKQVDDMNCKTT
jgi:monofunctional chorismate mutase